MITRDDVSTITLELDVTIRSARREDLPRLEWFGLYTHYRRMFLRTFEEQLQGQRLMLVADHNHYPIGQVFIHLPDAQPALRRPRRRGYLYALRVLEPFQGHGLGTHLILAAEAILQERGYQWVVIAVAKDNPGARRLYERLGYTVFSEDPGQWHYTDHLGNVRHVDEPSWMLQKAL
jgi:ribosomal protein S18 acetylase RimI-like enzyme